MLSRMLLLSKRLLRSALLVHWVAVTRLIQRVATAKAQNRCMQHSITAAALLAGMRLQETLSWLRQKPMLCACALPAVPTTARSRCAELGAA